MMAWIFTLMTAVGILLCCLSGNGTAALDYMLEGADSAVTLSLSLAGSYILWTGIMNIAKRAGLIEGLSRLMMRPLRLLMPKVGEAAAPITLNLAANFFGIGNAATPFGLEAMRQLSAQAGGVDYCTNEICMFLALNSSAIELLPTSVLAVRASCGSTDVYSIVLPTLLSSIAAAVAAIAACKAFESIYAKFEEGNRNK